jgi:NAD(P)-dependent dehydrogenase (short-subunit alcohol dehydrogenase family)
MVNGSEPADLFDLRGRVAFVAGGAGYLALPACRALLRHGARVMIGDIDEPRIADALGNLRSECSPESVDGLTFDIGDEASINEAITTTLKRFGRLDICVNATARGSAKVVEALVPEDFSRSLRINLTGSFFLARAAAGVMQPGGSIIMFSSMYGLIAPNESDYPAGLDKNPVDYGIAKAGIGQLVRYLAAHYGKKNIRVNAIAPGAFPWKAAHHGNEAFVDNLSAKSMLGRIGRRHETAGTVIYLAADASSFVTGQVISVDGGVTAW